MQRCQRCKRLLEDGERVMIKCPAVFEQFSPGVHRATPEDVEEIWCLTCEEEDFE